MNIAATDLARAYLRVDCGDHEMNCKMVHTVTLLLEGKLEEAYTVAESLCEPYRNEIQGRIRLLAPQFSLTAGIGDQIEIFLFTLWLNDKLSDPSQFDIRDRILYDITTGAAPLAYRHAEELTDPLLTEEIENEIRKLITSYRTAGK